jgi:hypothetical protein
VWVRLQAERDRAQRVRRRPRAGTREVKDKNYASEDALETAYEKTQTANIGAKDEAWLKARYETDATLRADITARFNALCPGDPASAPSK